MTPMLQGTNKSIELFVIGGLLLSGVIELFTEKGNWLAFLVENTTNSQIRSITINFKQFGEIWKHKGGCLRYFLLEKFKALLGFFRLLKHSSLKAFCDGSNNGAAGHKKLGNFKQEST
jgi:hypothetical protein